MAEREQAGLIFVDGMEVGDIEDVALRDRRMLSADGIFIVVATISEQDGRSVVPPEIIFRGVPFVEESDSFVDELREAVDDFLFYLPARTAGRWRWTHREPAGASAEQAGLIFVDGMEVGDIEDVALRDRRMLSADGIFIVVATISEQDGRSVVPPEIIFRGVPFVEESDSFVEELRQAVDESLAHSAEEEITEIDLVQDHLHDDVAEFVYDRLKRRPMILPVVVEV